jgi:hypothetical protein
MTKHGAASFLGCRCWRRQTHRCNQSSDAERSGFDAVANNGIILNYAIGEHLENAVFTVVMHSHLAGAKLYVYYSSGEACGQLYLGPAVLQALSTFNSWRK